MSKKLKIRFSEVAYADAVNLDDLRKRFLTLNVSGGKRIGQNLFVDLSFEYALQNLLNEVPETNLTKELYPYYLSLGFNIYI